MKLEKIMKKEDLLKQGFKEIITGEIPILYKDEIIYYKQKDNLYKKAKKLA